MIRVLAVAEKAIAAEGVARVLSGGSCQRRGSNWDFQCNVPRSALGPAGGQGNGMVNVNMVMTAVSGHFKETDFSSEYSSWQRTAPGRLFGAPIHRNVSSEKSRLEQNIVSEARQAQVLMIWTDGDREGEAIGQDIADTCLRVKPSLIVKRARFSVVNHADVWNALNNMQEIDTNMVNAVHARMEIDLRVGAVFTRFQTLLLQKKFGALDGKVLSFGTCQFPTLGLIVDRYRKVENFVSEPFWSIRLGYTPPNSNDPQGSSSSSETAVAGNAANQSLGVGQQQHQSTVSQSNQGSNPQTRPGRNQNRPKVTDFNWQRGHLFDQLSCFTIYETCIANPTATVVDVSGSPKNKYAPVPLSTLEMQKRLASYERMSSARSMQVAEGLYQRGILSYPRTETDSFTNTFDLRALVEIHRPHSQWGSYASELLDSNKFVWPRNGGHNDNAHPPIHPVKFVDDLQGEEAKVYEFVTRHFLACCSQAAKLFESKIQVDVAGELFNASGTMILERNYLDVYKYERIGERSLPPLQVGDTFLPSVLTMNESVTRPPNLLSETDLLTLMAQCGIGTDATTHEHIKKVQDREYAVKIPQKNNRFAPTRLGIALIEGYEQLGHEDVISKPLFRSEMERNFAEICEGTKGKAQVVNHIVARFKQVFDHTSSSSHLFASAVEKHFSPIGGGNDGYTTKHDSFSKCGACGTMMALKQMDSPATNIQSATRGGSSRGGGRGGSSSRGGGRTSSGSRGRQNNAGVRSLLFCNTCKSSHRLPGQHQDVAPHAHICPLCNYQVVTLKSKNGEPYTVCPKCYDNNPTNETQGQAEQSIEQQQGSMPCFNCTAECDLAGKRASATVPVTKCPVCRIGDVLLKSTRNGKVYMGCNRFPDCKHSHWFPNSITSATVEASQSSCTRHGQVPVKKVKFNINRQLAGPSAPPSIVGCPISDCSGNPTLLQDILYDPTAFRPARQQTGQTTTTVAAPQSGYQQTHSSPNPQPQVSVSYGVQSTMNQSGSNQQQQVCYKCQQPGHFASNCPNSGSSAPQYGGNQSGSNQQQQVCYKCQQPGHFASNCPNSGSSAPQYGGNQSGSNQQQQVCYKCQQPGHFANNCPNSGSSAPQYGGNQSGSNQQRQVCYKCQQPGHFANNCPNSGSSAPQFGGNQSGSNQQQQVCYKCQQPGHFANNCPNSGSQVQPNYNSGNTASGTSVSRSQSKGSKQPKPSRICPSCGVPYLPRKRTCKNERCALSKKR